MEFVDIAGLVAGAAQGEGLGNQFLAHIYEKRMRSLTLSAVLMTRISFMLPGVFRQRMILRSSTPSLRLLIWKRWSASTTEPDERRAPVIKMRVHYRLSWKKLRTSWKRVNRYVRQSSAKEEKVAIREFHFITAKPVLYIANVAEDGLDDNPLVDIVREVADAEGAEVVVVSNRIEAEVAELEDEERAEFLDALGIEEPGLNRVIRAGYKLLGLQQYFTAGPKEVRAWTIPVGAKAPASRRGYTHRFREGIYSRRSHQLR